MAIFLTDSVIQDTVTMFRDAIWQHQEPLDKAYAESIDVDEGEETKDNLKKNRQMSVSIGVNYVAKKDDAIKQTFTITYTPKKIKESFDRISHSNQRELPGHDGVNEGDQKSFGEQLKVVGGTDEGIEGLNEEDMTGLNPDGSGKGNLTE